MSRVLIVEDESNVRIPLEAYLVKEGYEVFSASNLSEAEKLLKKNPDVILLDWKLPDGQGVEALRKWRTQGLTASVILVTARVDLVDKVMGLELGANDYMTKPYEPRELVARIRVQTRDQTKLAIKLEDSGITLDLTSYEGFFEGERIELTKTEFELLKVFLENPNQVFSRDELLNRVWGYDKFPTTRTVDVHIVQLRQKTKPHFFETVHRIGYRFRSQKEKTE